MDHNQAADLPQRKRLHTWRRWVVLLVCAVFLIVGLFALWETGTAELCYAVCTPRDALELLLETYPMPEDAVLVEDEHFWGWKTPFVPVGGDQTSTAQQSSTQLCYFHLTPNEKYYEFWLYSALLDIPSTGEGHCSTLNFYAVNRSTGEILVERTGDGMESWDVYLDAIAH